jgi:hypothetical protein
MTFIIEAVKEDHRTVDIGLDQGPTGDRYAADRFHLLLTSTILDSQRVADNG